MRTAVFFDGCHSINRIAYILQELQSLKIFTIRQFTEKFLLTLCNIQCLFLQLIIIEVNFVLELLLIYFCLFSFLVPNKVSPFSSPPGSSPYSFPTVTPPSLLLFRYRQASCGDQPTTECQGIVILATHSSVKT